MLDASLIPWLFAAIMAAGVTFLLISIFLGGMADLDTDVDVGGIDIDGDGIADVFGGDGTPGESRNLGCLAISAFLAGFGAMGLLGSLAHWHLAFSLLAGLGVGLVLGRATTAILHFVVRQESSDLLTADSLIGAFARVTVNTPAGRTGEALVEGKSLLKYPVRVIGEGVELKKGDYVEIVEVRSGCLYVKKKRTED